MNIVLPLFKRVVVQAILRCPYGLLMISVVFSVILLALNLRRYNEWNREHGYESNVSQWLLLRFLSQIP